MLLNFIRGFSLVLLLSIIASHTWAKQLMQYPDHAEATKNVVVVRVVWMEPDEVNKFCNGGTVSEEYVILGCFDPSSNTIYTPQPRSFNDRQRLVILGHEFWHALGADHP